MACNLIIFYFLSGYWSWKLINIFYNYDSVQFSSVTQSCPTPRTAALQASLYIINSHSLPKLMSIELVMPSNHLNFCYPLLLLPSFLPRVRVFSNRHVSVWELDYKESWAPKNWNFWTVVLEKTLESPLDRKEIQPVHPKGNQSWVFIGRINVEAETPIFWPPDVKSWLIWKDPDVGKDWRQEEKGTKGWDG